jgi:hypothetical protein
MKFLLMYRLRLDDETNAKEINIDYNKPMDKQKYDIQLEILKEYFDDDFSEMNFYDIDEYFEDCFEADVVSTKNLGF